MRTALYLLGIAMALHEGVARGLATNAWSTSLKDPREPPRIHVGAIARRRLSPEDIEFFESLHIPPDRPDQFLKDAHDLAPLRWISEEQKQELIFLGSLAGAAYCGREPVLSWSCGDRCDRARGMNITRHFHESTTDIWGYVGVHAERREVLVVFRGSSSFKNWVYNLYFSMTSVPWKLESFGLANPTLHEGFLLAYESVSSTVAREVQRLLGSHPQYAVRVVGHSLGGALATLCAMELNDLVRHRAKVRLTTFESPRVGNDDFARLLRIHFPNAMDRIRVTNGRDVVVRLPPYLLGYRHATQEVFIPPTATADTTAYLCDEDHGEDPRCANAYLSYSIDDHLSFPWGLEFGTDDTAQC